MIRNAAEYIKSVKRKKGVDIKVIRPRGYIVAFVPFNGGKPSGEYKVFMSGFWPGDMRPEVWGRPAGIAVAKDGSVLVADDASNTIWRISYTGK